MSGRGKGGSREKLHSVVRDDHYSDHDVPEFELSDMEGDDEDEKISFSSEIEDSLFPTAQPVAVVEGSGFAREMESAPDDNIPSNDDNITNVSSGSVSNNRTTQQYFDIAEKVNSKWVCPFVDNDDKRCCRAFSKKHDLRYHLNTHTAEKPYQCSKCNKSYGNRSNLNTHEQTHLARSERKLYPCPNNGCNDTFIRISSLRIHMNERCANKIRRRNRQKKIYLCSNARRGCTQTFTRGNNRMIHEESRCKFRS